jgi:probable HAF family extracellular repeat protein
LRVSIRHCRYDESDFKLVDQEKSPPKDPIMNVVCPLRTAHVASISAVPRGRSVRRALAATAWLVLSSGASAQWVYQAVDLGIAGRNSVAKDINNVGQVVGYADAFAGPFLVSYATLWNGTTATTLGTLTNPEYRLSRATGINDAGKVVGWETDGTFSNYSPIAWNGAVPTTLASSGFGSGINNAGQVVGSSQLGGSGSPETATLWNGSTPTYLGGLGGPYSTAIAINDGAQIVGQAALANGRGDRAVLWDGTVATDLGAPLGGSSSGARGINNAGLIVGYSYVSDGSGPRAVAWNGSTATQLGSLFGDVYSDAYGVNNSGQIVGVSALADRSSTRATLWNGTVAIDLNEAFGKGPEWTLTDATGINDAGWISANGFNYVKGESHAFMLVPTMVPDPAAYVTLLFGLGIVGVLIWRHRAARG